MKQMDVEKLFWQAQAYRKEYKTAEAIALFHRITNKVPDSENYWYLLAGCYHEAKKFKTAIKYFDRSLEVNPNFKYSWFMKGMALSDFLVPDKDKDYKKAVEYFDKTLKIDPDYYEARRQIVLILTRELQEFDRSEIYCKEALKDLKIDYSIPKKKYFSYLDNYIVFLYTTCLNSIGLKKFEEAIEKLNSFIDILGYYSENKHYDFSEYFVTLCVLYLLSYNEEKFLHYLNLIKNLNVIDEEMLNFIFDEAKKGRIRGIEIPDFTFEFPEFYTL